MDAHEKFVREAVETAEDKADSWFSNWRNASADQMAGAVRQARELFTDWATRRKGWVSAGVNDDRRPYSLEEWLRYGNEIAALVTETTRDFNAYSTENAVEYTAMESVQDVADAAEELGETIEVIGKNVSRPWVLYAAGAGLGLGLLGYALRPLAQIIGKAREA
ncbi:hypothetical protein NR798_24135 [Archangium gephyra]|uniref:hypothetical protein n=1 Tax=Archangium gephyra TaxID=48 RepID=UPI0035D423E1